MKNLNEQQLSAVLCEDKKILCLAGAGTGKTSTMLERIHHLVNGGVDPSSILVMTFTNAAAFEMRDRYRREHSGVIIPEFRTFHSFCYYVLTTNADVRKSLGYLTTPTIADPQIRKRILREAGTITNIKSSIESLEKKKTLTTKERYEYDLLRKAESRLMKKRNTITFDALCKDICELFSKDAPEVMRYKDKYKYVFVDEFQDTDPVQYKFVNSFYNSSIFVVGDALQAIYAFRGADSSIIKKLSEDSEWRTIKLYKNYRSTKNICNFANIHSKHAKDSFRVAIESDRSGEDITKITNTNFVSFGCVDIDTTRYCIEDVMKHFGSTAIICRTNSEVNSIQKSLQDRGISYSSNNKDVDVPNVLKSVGDNTFLVEWLASYLNSEKYADYIRISTLMKNKNQEYTIIQFLQDFGNISSVVERWDLVKCIRRICKESNRSIMDRCKDILSVIDCEYLILDPSKCSTMKDAVEHIQDLFCNKEDKSNSSLYVGTIHSVKGLEFDNVYVVGVRGPNFQLNNEENRNLYYVAITRAKSHLVVFEKDDFYDGN